MDIKTAKHIIKKNYIERQFTIYISSENANQIKQQIQEKYTEFSEFTIQRIYIHMLAEQALKKYLSKICYLSNQISFNNFPNSKIPLFFYKNKMFSFHMRHLNDSDWNINQKNLKLYSQDNNYKGALFFTQKNDYEDIHIHFSGYIKKQNIIGLVKNIEQKFGMLSFKENEIKKVNSRHKFNKAIVRDQLLYQISSKMAQFTDGLYNKALFITCSTAIISIICLLIAYFLFAPKFTMDFQNIFVTFSSVLSFSILYLILLSKLTNKYQKTQVISIFVYLSFCIIFNVIFIDHDAYNEKAIILSSDSDTWIKKLTVQNDIPLMSDDIIITGIPVIFQPGTDNITQDSIKNLDSLGKALNSKKLRNNIFTIYNYIYKDYSDNFEQRKELSRKRSKKIKDYLENNFGLSEKQLEIDDNVSKQPLEGDVIIINTKRTINTPQ